MWKTKLSFIIWSCFVVYFQTQNCTLQLQGYVYDFDKIEPLPNAQLRLLEFNQSTTSDSLGFFEFNKLCPGDYHIEINHIRCESSEEFYTLQKDSLIEIFLDHKNHVLKGITIQSEQIRGTQNTSEIHKHQINDKADENLSEILEEVVGVRRLKNGNTISKPIVNGLYGNRITLLNHGVAQSGQSWGNDHSPEIDPLSSGKVEVVKGVSSLEYMGSNLGSLIKIESPEIGEEPHWHGKMLYFYSTNGRGNTLNTQLKKGGKNWRWNFVGTYKRAGDLHTPDYYLTNTGMKELNASLQVEKYINEDWKLRLYASTFNTELGVLRGSQIGNLTDLKSAFERAEPFFTQDRFHYSLNAPKQEVHHHLLKADTYRKWKESSLEAQMALQYDGRKEFDVRRGNRSELPELDITQYSFLMEVKYKRQLNNNWALSTGGQYQATNNYNEPETGIIPLIPNYNSFQIGSFARMEHQWKKSLLEFGGRYDIAFQEVAAISQSFPREIIRNSNRFHNFNAIVGYRYRWNSLMILAFNTGYATRNPAINELYSQGLHQGVSGIEEGDASLKTEKALKTTLNWEGSWKDKLSWNILGYYQQFSNYIFLEPQDEIRLTIRGAFPVFKYKQARASIYGLDLSTRWNISTSWVADFRYSYLRGDNKSEHLPLVNMPSNNLKGSLHYHFPNSWNMGAMVFQNIKIEVNEEYVFRQNHLFPNQDYVPAPKAYHLLGVEFLSDIQLPKTNFRFNFRVSNLTNEKYRDYLNRLRYFADEEGRNFTFGIIWSF